MQIVPTTCLKMNDEAITLYADGIPVISMNSDAIDIMYGLEPIESIESIESPKRLKCEYCGTINNKNYGLCDYCGAPLSD